MGGWIWDSGDLLRGHLSPPTSYTLDRSLEFTINVAQTPSPGPRLSFWLHGLCLRLVQVPVPGPMVRKFLASIPFPAYLCDTHLSRVGWTESCFFTPGLSVPSLNS